MTGQVVVLLLLLLGSMEGVLCHLVRVSVLMPATALIGHEVHLEEYLQRLVEDLVLLPMVIAQLRGQLSLLQYEPLLSVSASGDRIRVCSEEGHGLVRRAKF